MKLQVIDVMVQFLGSTLKRELRKSEFEEEIWDLTAISGFGFHFWNDSYANNY